MICLFIFTFFNRNVEVHQILIKYYSEFSVNLSQNKFAPFKINVNTMWLLAWTKTICQNIRLAVPSIFFESSRVEITYDTVISQVDKHITEIGSSGVFLGAHIDREIKRRYEQIIFAWSLCFNNFCLSVCLCICVRSTGHSLCCRKLIFGLRNPWAYSCIFYSKFWNLTYLRLFTDFAEFILLYILY